MTLAGGLGLLLAGCQQPYPGYASGPPPQAAPVPIGHYEGSWQGGRAVLDVGRMPDGRLTYALNSVGSAGACSFEMRGLSVGEQSEVQVGADDQVAQGLLLRIPTQSSR